MANLYVNNVHDSKGHHCTFCLDLNQFYYKSFAQPYNINGITVVPLLSLISARSA